MKTHIQTTALFLTLTLLPACTPNDAALQRKTQLKKNQIKQLETELANLKTQPLSDLSALQAHIDLQTKKALQEQQKIQPLLTQIETAQKQLDRLHTLKQGHDKITFASGLQVVGHVQRYANGKLYIQDGNGTQKSGRPSSIKNITFRQENATPSNFPQTQKPKKKKATPTAKNNAPARLEIDMVRRSMKKRRGNYYFNIDVEQNVSFTIRVTNREPLKNWENITLELWAISRDVQHKKDYRLIMRETTTLNILRGQTVEFNTKKIRIQHYDSRHSSYKAGYKYYGYLLKLYDADGNPLKTKRSHSKLERDFIRFKNSREGQSFTL